MLTKRERERERVSGFHHKVDDNNVLLVYYVASCGNCLPTFRHKIGPIFKGQETKTKLPLLCAITQKGTDLKSVREVVKGAEGTS